MSTIKVQNIQHTASSTNAIALASDGTCTANITNNLSNRNLIINGAMQVAQRGTSSTSNGYQTVDRYNMNSSGHDEAPTQAQADVAAGTSPYNSGFRKSLKITNGNQTSGAGAADRLRILYIIESQDIANSGWNYTDSNSKITLSFWIKSSVAQNFYFRATSADGTVQNLPMETGVLSADTWTKITKTIPGNSNLTFNNDNGIGLYIIFALFRGTDNTGSITLDAWANNNPSVLYPDNTSTWYTTNDATWELTGLQLEVGSVATDFEHRSFGQELALCQRYYTQSYPYGVAAGSNSPATVLRKLASGQGYDDIANFHFPTEMRAVPTIALYNPVTGTVNGFRGDSNDFTGAGIATATTRGVNINRLATVTATVYTSIHATASAEL